MVGRLAKGGVIILLRTENENHFRLYDSVIKGSLKKFPSLLCVKPFLHVHLRWPQKYVS